MYFFELILAFLIGILVGIFSMALVRINEK